ncbi:MAG: hypothetical protein CFE21_02180 [Bacteroidetes bacterium B1(2017)]|nr:MAG: hypothetical protein CFE21_02180 [Bacteroidetes bacterium B1(2017)]
MKKLSKHSLIILILLSLSIRVGAQQPYVINPANGLPVLDASNKPMRGDKNYIAKPVLEEEFVDEASTKLNFNYGVNLYETEMAYFVMEHAVEDNCHVGQNGVCPVCNNLGFWGTKITYPVAHFYKPQTPTSTFSSITLVTQKYAPDYVKGWYKKDCKFNNEWQQVPQNYTYTTGVLNSLDAIKYGYIEARFKINRPVGPSNTGIGQCFWLFSPGGAKCRNLPETYVRKYCYGEIDISEQQPNIGASGFGAVASVIDPPFECNRDKWIETTECSCDNCTDINGKYLSPDPKSIFHPFVDQDHFHTYALEWTPSSLKFFYDNRLLQTINTLGKIGKTPKDFDPMIIVFDIEAALGNRSYHVRCSEIKENVTVFPFEFEIDYVRQYKLDLSQCNLDLPRIYNQTSFNNFNLNPKVRKRILVGDKGCTTCSILVNKGMNINLRASQEIELNDGFEVKSEGEFFADVIGECDNGY